MSFGCVNIEMFCTNKMPRFKCHFELYNQKSEHMHIGLIKYSLFIVCIIEICMLSFGVRFQRKVVRWGSNRSGKPQLTNY